MSFEKRRKRVEAKYNTLDREREREKSFRFCFVFGGREGEMVVYRKMVGGGRWRSDAGEGMREETTEMRACDTLLLLLTVRFPTPPPCFFVFF